MVARTLDALSTPAFVVGTDHRVLAWNSACEVLTGIPAEAMVGTDRQWEPFYGTRRPVLADLVVDKALDSLGSHYANHGVGEFSVETLTAETWFDNLGGRRRYMAFEARSLIANGRVVGALEMLQDITRHQAAEDRIRHMAQHDPLTGLANRAMMDERLAAMAAADERFAVAFIDLDNFKMVNDALGHDVGDRLLRKVAGRLAGAAAEGDTVSRLGGDEFVLLLRRREGATTEARAADILSLLHEPYVVDGHGLTVSASIGISLFPEDGSTATDLIRAADMAMYRAKGAGRNACRFFTTDMDADARENLLLAGALPAALHGQMFLEYQPQLRLGDGALIGAEALLRWRHPERGLVSPSKFIPLAEGCGAILDIGEWVLRTACATIRETGTGIAVNLSPLQLAQPDIVAQVRAAAAGLPPGALCLEVTEGAFLGDLDRARAVLRDLKGLGVGLALDDFGTGYSSLSYLRHLPFDYIKIDQSFVRDPASAPIVTAIIGMARGLGMDTIAEGVETAGQQAAMAALGCTAIQGYHYARPMGLEAFRRFPGVGGAPAA
jgi:diguanylate cyclase (GGDEF)-like protein